MTFYAGRLMAMCPPSAPGNAATEAEGTARWTGRLWHLERLGRKSCERRIPGRGQARRTTTSASSATSRGALLLFHPVYLPFACF